LIPWMQCNYVSFLLIIIIIWFGSLVCW
jgi:hypothetical protein